MYNNSYVATIEKADFGISKSSNTIGLQLTFKFYTQPDESASYTATGDKLKCSLNYMNAVEMYSAMSAVEALLNKYNVRNISELVGKQVKIYFNDLQQFEKFDCLPNGKLYERKPQTVRAVKYEEGLEDGFDFYDFQGNFVVGLTKEEIIKRGYPKAPHKVPFIMVDKKKVLIQDENSYLVTTESGNRFPVTETMFHELYEEGTRNTDSSTYQRQPIEMGDL